VVEIVGNNDDIMLIWVGGVLGGVRGHMSWGSCPLSTTLLSDDALILERLVRYGASPKVASLLLLLLPSDIPKPRFSLILLPRSLIPESSINYQLTTLHSSAFTINHLHLLLLSHIAPFISASQQPLV
jgi:hypothetical protein